MLFDHRYEGREEQSGGGYMYEGQQKRRGTHKQHSVHDMHDAECYDSVFVDKLRGKEAVAPYKLSDIMPQIAYQVSLFFQIMPTVPITIPYLGDIGKRQGERKG